MKRMIVWGYWAKNLGDDLFLESLLALLKNSSYQIFISCKRKHASYYRQLGVKVIYNDSLVYRACRKILIDPFVLITKNKPFVMLGGSLFAETGKAYDSRRIRDLKFAIKQAKASFVIGSNFEPIKSTAFREKYHDLFASVNSACFRDLYSYEQFKSIENVKYAPDVVLAGYWDKDDFVEAREYVGFSVIDFSFRNDLRSYQLAYERWMSELVKIHHSQGDKILLLAFCEDEGDIKACERVRELSGLGDYVNILKYDDFGFLHQLKKCKKIYGTRFHSIILSLYCGINCVPIAYNEKVTHALDSYIDGETYAVFPSEFDNLSPQEIYKRPGIKGLDRGKCQQAEEQFEQLKLFVEEAQND